MQVLVGCEKSGRIRDAFALRGAKAFSCDVLPDETGSAFHIQDDLRNVMRTRFFQSLDLFIAHPPCTRLCLSGAMWLHQDHPPPGKTYEEVAEEFRQGVKFFCHLWNSDLDNVVLENPEMHPMAKRQIQKYCPNLPRPEFYHPYMFGDPFFKLTGLWRRGVPRLRVGKEALIPPADGPERQRWKFVQNTKGGEDRSRTFPGFAQAIAAQWGPGAPGSEKDQVTEND